MEHVVEAKADVKVIETKIAEYSPTAAALADLQHRFRGIVFDVTTTKGDKEAREARYELVKLRTSLEAKRKELKAPALERSRLIDDEAGRIKTAIEALEEPIDDQIRKEEQRKETERQAKIDAEARRVETIRENIAAIAGMAVRAVGLPSADVEAKTKLVVALEITPAKFAEFVEEAKAVHADTLAKLREIHTAALASETEAARIAAERVELEQLRRADAERRAAEEVRAAAARKAEDARLAREREQLEADRRAAVMAQAMLDAEAAERRRAADQEAAARRAEEDRNAREQREAERRRQDEAARAERAALEAEREAEAQRIADGQAALRREQEARDRAEREAREEAERKAQAERAAAELAQTRLQGAAKPMLDALLLWRTVDNARLARNTDAYKQAVAAREGAIALATTDAGATS